MARTCPGCGTSAEFTERTALVLEGDCPSCGRTLMVVPAGAAAASGASPTDRPEELAGPASAPRVQDGPACSVCGSTLEIKVLSEASLEASCPSCETVSTYTLQTPGEPERPRGRPARGPRFERIPEGDDRPSRARPCRECGGPLRFTTDPDGNVTGECGSCGNRFTLPPRREFGGSGDRRSGGPRRGDGGRPRYGRPGPWTGSSGRPRSFRPGGRPFRRAPERDDGDDAGRDDRRRRRPRRY